MCFTEQDFVDIDYSKKAVLAPPEESTAEVVQQLARLQQWLPYWQEPRFEFHLQSMELFTCNKVSPNPLTYAHISRFYHGRIDLEVQLDYKGTVRL